MAEARRISSYLTCFAQPLGSSLELHVLHIHLPYEKARQYYLIERVIEREIQSVVHVERGKCIA